MNRTDFKIFISILEMIKNDEKINKSTLAKRAGVDRKTIYNKIEKYTFQDLEKYKLQGN